MAFFGIYVSEAHPMDGRVSKKNVDAEICFLQPKTFAERIEVAKAFIAATGYQLPLLLDTMDNATAEKFAALPDRLVVVDSGGAVAYQGAMGPHGFDPEAWAAITRKQVAVGSPKPHFRNGA